MTWMWGAVYGGLEGLSTNKSTRKSTKNEFNNLTAFSVLARVKLVLFSRYEQDYYIEILQ